MAILPLLIIDRLGPAAAGHYALAWVIGYSLYLVSMNMGSSLVVETAADQSEIRDRALRSITHPGQAPRAGGHPAHRPDRDGRGPGCRVAALAARPPSRAARGGPAAAPGWRDCVCSASGWEDASRLYELPGGRQLVLMMARRPARPSRLTVEASWPPGWGQGGVLAPGGVRPEEVAFICADIARQGTLSTSLRPGFPVAPARPGVD